ncbi:DUF1641 domain-containing protein [Kyrpidia tusciae]|uniref:DUF1641 domain-containing protein n=1 Tax=Kyrpidia tusciae (strain DSM 2912 / NBRC 15312 / T2) TaxID=562970 RepID=D5WQX9_KYRT2|nr:DUF1641 domain-containing protein [Kyrpidia tusciae]ADG06738.1 hypothetical protein Btus_2048 [Kyrpidia tusciae DSM 2912]
MATKNAFADVFAAKGGAALAQTGGGAVVETIHRPLEEKLLDEQTTEQLVHLLDKLASVSSFIDMIDMIENFLRRGPEIADSINDLIIFLRQDLKKSEYVEMLHNASHALHRIHEMIDSPQVQELFQCDVLDLRVIRIIGKAARSLVQASKATAQTETNKIGVIGLMRLVADPEIQPTIHFLVNFARQFSKEIQHA